MIMNLTSVINENHLHVKYHDAFAEIDAMIYVCGCTGLHANVHKYHVNNELKMLERFG
jgi:hypothetical protein